MYSHRDRAFPGRITDGRNAVSVAIERAEPYETIALAHRARPQKGERPFDPEHPDKFPLR